METFVILFSATNKLVLTKGQVYHIGNVEMGMLMRQVLLIIAACLPTWTFAADYICLAEKANGFKYKEGTWSHMKLATDEKYLVSFKKGKVSRFGESDVLHSNCFESSVDGTHTFNCFGSFGEFIMSADTLKYQLVVPWIDYVIDETSGTPHIELGTCSKL